MRGKKAKAIRRAIYGDGSKRAGRENIFIDKNTGQIIGDNARRAYQIVKKEAQKGKPLSVERRSQRVGAKERLKRFIGKGGKPIQDKPGSN